MIHALQHENKAHEVCYIANIICEKIDHGTKPEDIAVIYRKNSNGAELMNALIKRKIPVVSSQKLNVLDNPYIQKFVKYLEYIYQEISYPYKGEYLCYELMIFDADRQLVNETVKTVREEKVKYATLPYFQDIVQYGSVGTVSDIMSNVFNRYFLDKLRIHPNYINELNQFNSFFNHIQTEINKDRIRDIKDLLMIIRRMQEMDILLPYYQIVGMNKGVNLITAHSSKGLEYDTVMIMDAISTNWESMRSGGQNYSMPDTLTISIDEEEADRRLMYVAVTRAKKECYIHFSSASEDGKLLQPSRFVHELNVDIKTATVPHNITEYIEEKLALSASKYELIQEREYVADMLTTYKLSPSHLNAYMECPYGFYHNYILRVPAPPSEPMMYGNAVHNTLQKYYENAKKGEDMSYDDVIELFRTELYRYRNSLTHEQLDRKLHAGIKSLEKYYPVMAASNKVTLNEFAFDVIIEGVPCFLKIDKMAFDGHYAEISDYKTGKLENTLKECGQPDEKNEFGGKIWRQLMMYKIAMDYQKQFPYTAKSINVDVIDIKENRKIELEYSLQDINTIIKLITSTYAKIMNQEFTDGCGECRWCKTKMV